jgi:hypothetical protein
VSEVFELEGGVPGEILGSAINYSKWLDKSLKWLENHFKAHAKRHKNRSNRRVDALKSSRNVSQAASKTVFETR